MSILSIVLSFILLFSTPCELIVTGVQTKATSSSASSGIIYPDFTSYKTTKSEVDLRSKNYAKDATGRVYPYSYHYYLKKGQTYKDAYVTIYDAIRTFKRTAILLDYELSFAEVEGIIKMMNKDVPNLFWWDTNKTSVTFDSETKKVIYVTIGYSMTKKAATQAQAQIDKKVNAILNKVPKNASLYDTYLFFHDTLILNTRYDTKAEEAHNSDIYGVFIKGNAQCLGYTKAFNYLVQELGIITATQTGTQGVGHIWSVVQYQDNWVAIDVTWDDTDLDWGPMPEQPSHMYFMLSDKLLKLWHPTTAYAKKDPEYYPTPSLKTSKYAFFAVQDKKYTLQNAANQYLGMLEVAELLLNEDDGEIEVFIENKEDYLTFKNSVLTQSNRFFSKVLMQAFDENCRLMWYYNDNVQCFQIVLIREG